MAGGYVVPPDGPLGDLIQAITDVKRRIRELEAPTGTQTAEALQQIQDILAGLLNPSSITTTGSVTAGTTVNAGTNVNVGGYVYTPAGYGYDITYTRRSAWLGNDGRLGYASSSREKKTNIRDAKIDPKAVLAIVPRLFKYRAEVAKNRKDPDYEAATEFGAIAEELHDLGLTEVVFYEDGKPAGIHYDLLGLLAIVAAQSVNTRVDALEKRLEAAGF